MYVKVQRKVIQVIQSLVKLTMVTTKHWISTVFIFITQTEAFNSLFTKQNVFYIIYDNEK